MAINQAPPPPHPAPVPAQVQTVNAAHAQRLASPVQSVINDINSGKYGKGFTASMPNAMNAANDWGSVAHGIGDARNRRNINRENNSPSRKGPEYAIRPPDKSSGNNAIANVKVKSANSQQSAYNSAPQASQNKGIAAALQKSTLAQSETTQSSDSTNKGISSFQSRVSGQSSSASRGSSAGVSKGGQSR